MAVVELSGKTVDDAVEKALGQLGLSRDQVDVDVIREGKRGLLGLGSEEAIVRVTSTIDVVTAAGAPRDGDGPQEGRSGGRRRGRRGGLGGDRDRGEGQRGGDSGPRGHDDDRRDRPAGDRPSAAPSDTARAGDSPVGPSADAEDEVDFAGRTLRDILNMLELENTQITVRDPSTPGDGVDIIQQVFDIYGDNEDASDELGLLIGRRGDTLRALQYLLNTMVRNRYDGDHVFGIDIEEYRARRERSLVEMAQRIAQEVRETGDVITLEPMRASERRIVHIALREEPGVITESVGEGEDRQVEVLPE